MPVSAFLSLSLPHSHPSTSSFPPGCARVLSGWCHGCVWDDDLWLWSGSVPLHSVLSASRNELELRMGEGGWGCLMDGPLLFPGKLTWTDRCQDVIFFSDNLFYKRLNSEQKMWPFQKDIGQQKRLKLFKLDFLHGFPFSKRQRSAKCLTWNYPWTYSSAVCESSPQWPCSIAGLAVVVFIAPHVCTVQYSLLTWCLQQNVQAMMVDGDWNMQKGG